MPTSFPEYHWELAFHWPCATPPQRGVTQAGPGPSAAGPRPGTGEDSLQLSRASISLTTSLGTSPPRRSRPLGRRPLPAARLRPRACPVGGGGAVCLKPWPKDHMSLRPTCRLRPWERELLRPPLPLPPLAAPRSSPEPTTSPWSTTSSTPALIPGPLSPQTSPWSTTVSTSASTLGPLSPTTSPWSTTAPAPALTSGLPCRPRRRTSPWSRPQLWVFGWRPARH